MAHAEARSSQPRARLPAARSARAGRRAWTALPGALASYLFFLQCRALASGIFHLRARAPGVHPAWKVVSEQSIHSDFFLFLLMVRAPRWNPHAISANAGPLRVRGRLEVELESVRASAPLWTVILYRHPRFEPVATVGSAELSAGEPRVRFDVAQGDYTVNVRYHDWTECVRMPAIRVDGGPAVAALPVSSANNDFFQRLRARSNVVFRWLHHHVYYVLQFRELLPAGFVRRLFLPVGNPLSGFEYGCIERGQSLRIRVAPRTRAHFRVYCTLYDAASFPLYWAAVEAAETHTPPAAARGFFLIRVCRASAVELGAESPQLEVSLVEPC
jgi:hypothetical protein